jgi:acetylglutamate/LysW-gamma-L-alpha-aminoadipate kinase
MTTIVIKIGGGEGIELGPILDEFAELVNSGTRAVLVHGGSHETNVVSEQLGHPPTFIKSPSGHESRRTDRQTLEIFEMVYCGKTNKGIVEHLQTRGVNAVGLSGIDGGLWKGVRKGAIRAVDDEGRTTIIRDDLSGKVESCDASLINLLLDSGRTPVLTPPALAVEGDDPSKSVAINVDADRAAAITAAAIGADELLLLSNVPGVLADPSDRSTLIASTAEAGIEAVREAAGGRMKNKVLAAEEALNGGVKRSIIGSANGAHDGTGPIAAARAGAGTVFEPATA